jgi:hypothetical protein
MDERFCYCIIAVFETQNRSQEKTLNFVTFSEFLTHPRVHHTRGWQGRLANSFGNNRGRQQQGQTTINQKAAEMAVEAAAMAAAMAEEKTVGEGATVMLAPTAFATSDVGGRQRWGQTTINQKAAERRSWQGQQRQP